ncbi:putative signal peptide protein [Puccinia sorghi]|uniref:Putative signal peptide protein n=1 Tax=Puccinia sorghi TaxID=27349 RepID=A0A0L6UL59_9BASI|nr:putative signal peptide protein [Puccinia sorghi]
MPHFFSLIVVQSVPLPTSESTRFYFMIYYMIRQPLTCISLISTTPITHSLLFTNQIQINKSLKNEVQAPHNLGCRSQYCVKTIHGMQPACQITLKIIVRIDQELLKSSTTIFKRPQINSARLKPKQGLWLISQYIIKLHHSNLSFAYFIPVTLNRGLDFDPIFGVAGPLLPVWHTSQPPKSSPGVFWGGNLRAPPLFTCGLRLQFQVGYRPAAARPPISTTNHPGTKPNLSTHNIPTPTTQHTTNTLNRQTMDARNVERAMHIQDKKIHMELELTLEIIKNHKKMEETQEDNNSGIGEPMDIVEKLRKLKLALVWIKTHWTKMASNPLITLALILVKKMNAPPPESEFQDPEEMVETMNRFVQDNGYDICIRRSEKYKKNIFKCDQYDFPFSILIIFFLDFIDWQ